MVFGPTCPNRGAGNLGEQLVQFKLSDAQRIDRAVQEIERSRRGRTPSHLPRAASGGVPLHLCKTTSDFNKGSSAILEIWEDGDFPNESKTDGATLEVRNKYADIPAGRFCSAALHGNGGWYVVAAEC